MQTTKQTIPGRPRNHKASCNCGACCAVRRKAAAGWSVSEQAVEYAAEAKEARRIDRAAKLARERAEAAVVVAAELAAKKAERGAPLRQPLLALALLEVL